MIEALTELIAHCQSPEAGGYTPSDFPLAGLLQHQLDRLLQENPQTRLGRAGEQIEDIYPLSPLQAGLLFHSLYTPEAGAYCVQLGWTIEGVLDEEAWRGAWQHVLNRHPILRTCFVWQGLHQPLQVVCRHVELPLVIQDWRSLSPQEQQCRLQALRQEHELTSVDVGKAPLLRLTLARLREQTYAFHLSLHHLIIDGWSQQLVLAEVQACYQALRQGKEPSFSPMRPYRDYIAWVHRQERSQAEQFWQTYLRGFSAPTRLPGDMGTSNTPSFQAVTQRLECSAELTSSL